MLANCRRQQSKSDGIIFKKKKIMKWEWRALQKLKRLFQVRLHQMPTQMYTFLIKIVVMMILSEGAAYVIYEGSLDKLDLIVLKIRGLKSKTSWYI